MSLKFENIIDDLGTAFQDFWLSLLSEAKIAPDTDGIDNLEVEVSKMFSTALFEACTKVLSEQEMSDLEVLLKTNPTLNPFDLYFASASTKPNIDEVASIELEDAKKQILFLFKSL